MPDSQNNNAHLDTGELRRYYRLDSVHFVSFRNVTPTENGIQEGDNGSSTTTERNIGIFLHAKYVQ